MDWQPRSYRYLLLQVWCALLTVAMVVMAVLFASIKPRPAENEALTLTPEVSPTANTIAAPLKATGSPLSHIEMIDTSGGLVERFRPALWELHCHSKKRGKTERTERKPNGSSWMVWQSCDSCFLARQNDSILCKKDSLYFLYAQVAFSKPPAKTNSKWVVLLRYPSSGREKKIVEGIYASTTESVWVSRVIELRKGDRVKINISGDFLQDISYWGAFELH